MLLRSIGGARKPNIDGMRSLIDEQNLSLAITSQVCGGTHVRRT